MLRQICGMIAGISQHKIPSTGVVQSHCPPVHACLCALRAENKVNGLQVHFEQSKVDIKIRKFGWPFLVAAAESGIKLQASKSMSTHNVVDAVLCVQVVDVDWVGLPDAVRTRLRLRHVLGGPGIFGKHDDGGGLSNKA